jgi:hypothetical protein
MAKQDTWIHVATRRIGQATMPGVETEEVVMAALCQKYPKAEWELKAVNFVGIEPNTVDVMFVFVARE